MGCTHRFRCRGCGYVAEVGGGPDRGFVVETRTVFCRTCGELRDVTVAYPDRNPADAWDRTHLKDEDLGRCGGCGGTDLTPWAAGDPCPRCGGGVADEGKFLDWD